MRSSFCAAFGISMLSAIVALSATDAAAAYVRTFSPSACVGTSVNTTTGAILMSGQLLNNTGQNLLDVCPVVSDSGSTGNAWNAATASAVRVNGWSTQAHSLRLYDCRTYATGGGGTCGSGVESSGTGVVNLSVVPSSAWSAGSVDDAYYVTLLLYSSAAVFSYNFVHP